MKLPILIGALVLLLAGCAGGPAPRSTIAIYDLGAAERPVRLLPLGNVDVSGPPWLAGNDMQYRLAAEPARRQRYAESQWAAAPAQLLEAGLQRAADGRGRCSLVIVLDEFVQSFDAAGDSQARLSLRATLNNGRAPLANRTFDLSRPAGRDARGGVAAFGELQQQLIAGLGDWLAQQSACR